WSWARSTPAAPRRPAARAARSTRSPARGASSLVLRSQADVERRRLAAVHVDVGHVGAVARLVDLDGVAPLGQIDHETVLALGRAPLLTVDEDLGVAGLDAHGERAEARGAAGARRGGRRRRRW